MVDTWREKRLPASFRSVPFFVDDDSTPVGRRIQLHEYPQRDKPLVEDLGAKTRTVKMSAFVIGDDCLFQRDNLLHALDQPGPGRLVHPWFGIMEVTPGEGCEVSHDRRAGGMVRFQLEFIEAGDKGYPVGVQDEALQLEEESESLLDSAIARYKTIMAAVNKARMASTVLQNGIAGVQMAIQQEMAQVMGLVSSVEGLADMLVNAPGNFSAMIQAQFSRVGGSNRSSGYRWGASDSAKGGSTVEADPQFARAAARLQRDDEGFTSYAAASRAMTSKVEAAQGLTAEIDGAAGSVAGGAATVAVINAARELVRDALMVQAVRVAASMPVVSAPAALPGVPVLAQQVAAPIERPEVPVRADVLALRDALSAALWAAALSAPHDHFEALEAVRKRAIAHLTEVANGGVRLVAIERNESLPALVLAYQCFADATRVGEIVTRNKAAHPGFLPVGTLYVAQE